MANLLSNAAKFSGNAQQVDVRILKVQHYKVEVKTTVSGIPEDFQKDL